MIVGDIIGAILSNFVIVLLAIAVVTSIVKIRRARMSRRPFSASFIVWGELLFYLYGIGNIYGGFFHAYAGQMAAASIGWQNSPFQYELGWFEMGYGAVALASLWRGREFRIALTLPYSIFLLAAAAQHINMLIVLHDTAPNNAGALLWVGDIAVPLVVLALAWLSRDE
ncbi:MAG: hypothetical protein KGN02_14950 [bacterium]|nr:hypothetical protein [bacterium]